MIDWFLIAFCIMSSVTPVLLILLSLYLDYNFEEIAHRLHAIQMQVEPAHKVADND